MRRRAVVVLCWLLSVVPALAHAADGDLDPSFGTGGVVTDPTGSGLAGLALRPDGAIMAAEIESGSLELLRYGAPGVLDPTFGIGGVVTQAAPGSSLSAFAVLPNGDLLVLAYGSSGTFVLARYDAAGAPIDSFGTDGVATLPDCGFEIHPARMLRQADGKIVIGIGSTDGTPTFDTCIVRVDASGILDASFGTGGSVTLHDWAFGGIGLQGTFLVLVGARATSTFPAAVTLLAPDGSLEGGFGDGGVFTHDVPGRFTQVVVRPTGSIIVVTDHGQVVGLTAKGRLDPSFGTAGVAEVEALTSYDVTVGTMALQPDGKIVAAATVGEVSSPIGSSGSVTLTRLQADGALDVSFGGDGTVDAVDGFESGLALQPDGKILVAAVKPKNDILHFPGTMSIARRYGLTLPCPASPAPICRGGVVSSAGKLRMDGTTNPKAKMQWAWQKGEATTLGDFGNPVGGDGYALCLYDESGTPALVSGAVLPGGGTCKAGKPCWKALGTSGFAYGDGAGIRFGIQSVKLKAGVDGKAQVKIQGRGPTLPVPALPAPLPLRLQLIADGGQCWQSVFAAAGLHRNDAGRFQGTSD